MQKRHFIIGFITVLMLFCVEIVQSQQIFSRTYGHFDFNYGKDIISCGTGYFVLGNTGLNDGNSVPMLIHIDSVGHILKTGFGVSNGVMSASKFVQRGNKLYVCGNIQNLATNDYDCFLSIFDTTLVLEKTTVYGGSSWDFAQSIIIQDTLIFVGGNSYSTTNGFSWGTITKLNLNGDSLNTYYYGTDGEAKINSLIVRGDSELLFTGTYQASDSLVSSAFIASFTLNGVLNWSKNLSADLGKSEANCITEGIWGHIAICGVTEKFDSVSMKDGFAYVLQNDNSYYRHEIYNNISNLKDEIFTSIAPTIEGDFFIGGTTKSFGAGGSDLYFFKINFGAWWLWSTTFGDVKDEDATKIIYQPSDSGFVLCGSSTFFGNFNNNILVVKTTKALTFDTNPTHELSVASMGKPISFSAYPNPTNGKISVKGEFSESIQYIEVWDLSGRKLGVISKENFDSNVVDLSQFASQILFLKIITSKGVETIKVLKQ